MPVAELGEARSKLISDGIPMRQMIVAGHVRRDAGRRPALPGQAYRLRMVGGGAQRSLGNTTKNADAGRRPALPG